MSDATRIVILGGGVGGLEAATSLGRRGDLSVVLVDRSNVHYWKPALHEFAAGTMLRQGNCIAFADTAAKFGFTFVQGEPAAVDRAARTVTLTDGKTIPYDYAVVALGSRANDFGIPGVADHCFFIDSLADADRLHKTFRADLKAAREAKRKLSIGIVGGGATGVQLAAQLCAAIDEAPGLGRQARQESLDAVLIETGPRILPAFPENVSTEATAELEKLGVSVRTGAMVVGVDEKGFNLKTGETIPATIRIWAAGVRASDATALFEGLDRGRSGQLSVTPTLQTTRDARIFAIGDCSRIEEAPVAPTAQVARQQGEYIAIALPQVIARRRPEPFAYHDRGAVVALADYNAWGMSPSKKGYGGGLLSGLFARMIHEGIYKQHLAGIVGVGTTIRQTLRERLSPVKPDLEH